MTRNMETPDTIGSADRGLVSQCPTDGGGYTLIDACVVAAWMNAELSEGQAMRALGLDRISARILRDKIVAVGVEMFALVNLGGTPESARNAIRDFDHMEPQRVCAHCQTQIIPAGLTECPKCDKPVMP